jgi:membrane protease YdiL (CAAX protease family)
MQQENNISTVPQYSLGKILAIWAAAAVPMAILGWVIAPALASGPPTGRQAFTTRVMVLTLGLVWQFVLAMIIVYREEGDLRWATIRRRLWLNTPRDPQTGRPRGRLWLWLAPLLALAALWELALHAPLDELWVRLFPFFAEPPGFSGRELLESPNAQAQLAGAWGFWALFAVNALFNTFLGEEFLLRGVLLPKMRGVFGKWDWLANGVLFGVYHLHQPWGIPGNIVSAALLESYPARRFRSVWMAIIVHSGQSVFFLFLLLGLVLGLA